MKTDTAAESTIVISADELPLSKPDELFTGKALPIKDWIFRTNDGQRKKVRLQGLSYAIKSTIDTQARIDREEAEKANEVKMDLRAPMIVASAMRNPDGSRAYPKYEDQVVAAIKLAEQLADGEVTRAYNGVMDVSGYSEEALADAGKS